MRVLAIVALLGGTALAAEWVRPLEAARAQARRDRKPLFVYVYDST